MSSLNDCLIEIGTEELPPKALRRLMDAFGNGIVAGLKKEKLAFDDFQCYATPRRLGVLIKQLVSKQADHDVEKRGPSLKAAYKDDGTPTPAALGFAKSCGIDLKDAQTLETDKGSWLVHRFTAEGQTTHDLLPAIVEHALAKLPIPKRMRWGRSQAEFVRPVHWIVMLHGDTVIPCDIMENSSDRVTYGHRFLNPEPISLTCANDYEQALRQAHVLANHDERKETIKKAVLGLVENIEGDVIIQEDLLEEVTGLVEWPTPLIIRFNEQFLKVPKEALVAVMMDHQRCFHVENAAGELLPYFITVSNIKSADDSAVVDGNRKVMAARFSDAQFFYETDSKHRLDSLLERLKDVVFQSKLGTLYEKAERIAALSRFIAEGNNNNGDVAERAGILCKADLMTDMVGEFPELQGTMGFYYGRHDGETEAVYTAIGEHYKPRFSKDTIPDSLTGCAVAIADKCDTLVGIFGINQIPTGDKDPFGLRRCAMGLLRIIIEKELSTDLYDLIQFSKDRYGCPLENNDVVDQTFDFVMERLKAWYQDQGIGVDIFAAVQARRPTKPLDFHLRMLAVQQFKQLPEAESLATANKRVGNILTKQGGTGTLNGYDELLLTDEAEKTLAAFIQTKQVEVAPLFEKGDYTQALSSLSSLRQPIDHFFDEVMVMAKDEKIRKNRLALLSKLRNLFLGVADISLLQ